MKSYRILLGSFVLPDGKVLQQGERIDLEDDVAAMHAHRVEALTDETAAPEAEPEA